MSLVEEAFAKISAELMAQNFQKDERIKELEAELMEQARVNGMGGEREAKLMARVERLEQALDVALEALEKHSTSLLNHEDEHAEAIAKLKEVRRD